MVRRLNKLYDLFCGHNIAYKIIKKYKGYKIISIYSGIGDRVFTLAYLKSYLSKNNISKYKIVSATIENVVYKYFGIDKDVLIYLPKKKMLSLNAFYTSDWGFSFRHRHPELLSVSADAYMRSDFFNYSELFYYSDIIKTIFKLPLSTAVSKVNVYNISSQLMKLFETEELIKGRTVIINPYANSCSEVPINFFQKISDKLRAYGFVIVTSTVGTQKSLDGTKGIDFELIEAIDFCNRCGFVIGQRSGFMDLISFSQARIICVDSILYPHSELFRLEKCWTQNENIVTVRYGSCDEEKLIDFTISIINKWSEYIPCKL